MKISDKQSDKRKAIMDASLKLFCEKCFQDTSTASISQAANVGTGTLFCYFSSKEELVNALYLEAKEELAAFVAEGVWEQNTFKARLKHIFERRIAWYRANREKIKFMGQYHSSSLITKITREKALLSSNALNEVVIKALEDGEVHSHSADLFTALISGYVHQSALYVAENAPEADLNKWQDEAFQVLWKGVS
ncbi:MAG: TetR/AcrR family transcriptional regulator [Chitinophagales bacterium]